MFRRGRKLQMAMFTAYFDDSGTHKQSDVAVAACFVSDVRRWKRFDVEWHQAATDTGDAFNTFHMADFEGEWKQFAGWSKDKKQRVLSRILNIIGKWTLQGFITAIVKEDYDRIVTGRLREKLGDYHYTFAIQSCLSFIEEWLKQDIRQPCEPVEYVFDRMSEGKGEINSLFDDLLKFEQGKQFGIEVGGWSFQDKTYFLPLQSADIIAWEGYRYMLECQLPQVKKDPRQSFQTLVERPNIRARFFDKETLPEFAREVSAQYKKLGWEGSPRGGFSLQLG